MNKKDIEKVVYFDRQGVVEYWTHSELFGWEQHSDSDGQSWPPGKGDFITQTCSDETFEKRHEGYIPG